MRYLKKHGYVTDRRIGIWVQGMAVVHMEWVVSVCREGIYIASFLNIEKELSEHDKKKVI